MTSSNQSHRCSKLSEALTMVTERYGTEVLNGEKPLYSIISDFLATDSPQGKQSLNLLKNAVQVGIPARIYGSITADMHTQSNTLEICKKLLVDNYGTSDDAAEEFVNSFAVALKWEVAGKMPAPKPTQANTVAATTVPPQNTDRMEKNNAFSDDANAENFKNNGRVAYYDGCYYYADYDVESILHPNPKIGIWKLDMKTQKKELKFATKSMVSSLNIADGWIYCFHHTRCSNIRGITSGKVIGINLNNPNERRVFSDELTSGDIDCPGLFFAGRQGPRYYNGWIYYSNYIEASLLRVRPDGSKTEIVDRAGACLIETIHNSKMGICEYTNGETYKLYLKDLDKKSEMLLYNVGEVSLYQFRNHGDYLYNLFSSDQAGENRLVYAPIKENTEFSFFGNIIVDSGNGVMNIYKDTIYYLRKNGLYKASLNTRDEQLIKPLSSELCKDCSALLVFDDWFFLDAGKKGLYAVSHDGKELREICS